MKLRVFGKRLAPAIREFIAPSYRPELHYMRGPGPAFERRAMMVEARPALLMLPGERK